MAAAATSPARRAMRTTRPARTEARTARPARAARRPYPARAIHLVDIENLAGAGVPAEWQVADLRRAYTSRVGTGPMDQVVIACNHKALPAVACGWPGPRYLIRSGPDGADTELLAVIAEENLAARFTHVSIASGDHTFAWAAASLATGGCRVTVISRSASLARTLRLAAQHVIYIDIPAAASTPAQPDAA